MACVYLQTYFNGYNWIEKISRKDKRQKKGIYKYIQVYSSFFNDSSYFWNIVFVIFIFVLNW